MNAMVEVTVARLGLDGTTNTYVVILRERDGERILPIWIGQAEAESILLEMNHVKKERPLTHDLCKTIIAGMGGELRRVNIVKVQKGTYYAELHITRGESLTQIDARPSDSIAIALRIPAPIYAEESLLMLPTEEMQTEEGEGAGEEGTPDFLAGEPGRPGSDEMTPEQLKQYLSSLRPEDFGKFNL